MFDHKQKLNVCVIRLCANMLCKFTKKENNKLTLLKRFQITQGPYLKL